MQVHGRDTAARYLPVGHRVSATRLHDCYLGHEVGLCFELATRLCVGTCANAVADSHAWGNQCRLIIVADTKEF